MTFPVGQQISTTNFAAGSGNPSLARTDLLALIQAVNDIIASANDTSGVLVLTGSGTIPSSAVPAQISLPQGTQVFNPVDRVVNIRDFLRIQVQSVDQIKAFATPSQGDIAFASDGDGGTPCLAVYDGSLWRTVRFATDIGSVQAALTSTSALSATAV
jgi:hypothetical protein